LSVYTTRDEIDFVISALEEILERLRGMLPSESAESRQSLVSDL
jgi:hypothetical protein